MTNADRFMQTFGIYATELWAKSEKEFLKWLNSEEKTQMKEIKLYQCEICGTQYKDKLKAKDCEKSHIKPVGIMGMKFNPMNCGSEDGFPVKITVTFENGACVDYRR